jgi:uncharacterized Rmd1/YagE family protein
MTGSILTLGRSYNLDQLQAYLSARPSSYRTHPRLFETECLHTPYLPPPTSSTNYRSPALKAVHTAPHIPEGDLLNLNDHDNGKSRTPNPRRQTGFSKQPGGIRKKASEDEHAESGDDDDFEEEEWVPDVFLFEYGTVVIWGMTEREEKAFLRSL